MSRNIRLVAPLPTLPELCRVGIYCRVSSPSPSQLHSLDTQASYLTRYVTRHPGWILTDIFLDVGSGGRGNERPAFNRMLTSIQTGSINTIITKSISRFGRDTESILSATRMITNLGATIFFEEQGISSSDPQSELYISLYGGIAQAERQNISDNIRWSNEKRISDGSSLLFDRPCYGYSSDDEGNFEIIPEEASAVRRIFNLYLMGNSVLKIKQALEKEGIPSPSGKPSWSKATIERILCNKKYCGYSFAGKGNTSVVLEQHHSAIIISQEMFRAVQEERSRRSNIELSDDGTPRRKSTRYTSQKASEGKGETEK